MKITHLLKRDDAGSGGAVAMRRLHLALREAGVQSRTLSEGYTPGMPDMGIIPRRWGRAEKLLRRLCQRIGLNDIHRISSGEVVKHRYYDEADVIHLHGLHGEFLSYLSLPKLTRNKPVVFTMHDVWAMTGHCSAMYDCMRWQTGCGKCPHKDVYPAIRHDTSSLVWKLKDWAYSRSQLTIVSPSKRLTEQARQSMLGRFPIHHIPHGLDTDVYCPHDREQVRSLLGINPRRRVLMYVSVDLMQPHKGADLLIEGLRKQPQSVRDRMLLLTIGRGGSDLASLVGLPTLDLGYISNDKLKAMAYSAADAFVLPTKSDNFPLVLLEAMACGTPLISFDIGGVPDMVRHGVTGYLARAGNTDDLAQGITNVLEDDAVWRTMSDNCRRIAVEEYGIELHAERHVALYRQLIDATNPSPRHSKRYPPERLLFPISLPVLPPIDPNAGGSRAA